MEFTGANVVVVGAGIGGLAASLVLARRGAKVRVLEQAPQIKEVGAGLQISPNGYQVLNALGLGQGLRANCVQAEHICLRNAAGKRITTLRFNLTGHTDYYCAHRADLVDLLLTAANEAGIEIVTGCKVAEVMPAAPPYLKDDRGQIHRADLIVGADGLHSVARAALNGTVAPFFAQQVAWRAVIPNAAPEPQVDLYMGAGRHVVSYPLRGGTQRNIVAVQQRPQWVAESWSQTDSAQSLQQTFADFGSDVTTLLGKVNTVHLWGLFRHPIAPVWHRDGVVLLGDAAHPTLPFLAQGANMALEDAWALGRCLSGAGSLDAGLASYHSMRVDRTTRVVQAANKNSWKYHIAFKPLQAAAHAVMWLGGAIAPQRMIGQFDWLYGYDVTRD